MDRREAGVPAAAGTHARAPRRRRVDPRGGAGLAGRQGRAAGGRRDGARERPRDPEHVSTGTPSCSTCASDDVVPARRAARRPRTRRSTVEGGRPPRGERAARSRCSRSSSSSRSRRPSAPSGTSRSTQRRAHLQRSRQTRLRPARPPDGRRDRADQQHAGRRTRSSAQTRARLARGHEASRVMSFERGGRHLLHRLRRSDDRHDRYASPLAERYASRGDAGALVAADAARALAPALARARRGASASSACAIPDDGDRRRCARTSTTSTSRRSAAYEQRFRHDVMAHVHAFGDAAPAARGVHPPRRHQRLRHRQRRPHPDARGPAAAARAARRACCARSATFARAVARRADARLHALPAGAAHDRRQARDALDAGPRARPRGPRPPARDAAASAA